MSKVIYLVCSKREFGTPFIKQYRLFSDSEKAMKFAKSEGLQNFFGESLQIGRMMVEMGGDVDVFILPLVLDMETENNESAEAATTAR